MEPTSPVTYASSGIRTSAFPFFSLPLHPLSIERREAGQRSELALPLDAALTRDLVSSA